MESFKTDQISENFRMEPWVVFGELLCLSIANLNVIKVTCRQNKPTSKIWIFKKPERKGPIG